MANHFHYHTSIAESLHSNYTRKIIAIKQKRNILKQRGKWAGGRFCQFYFCGLITLLSLIGSIKKSSVSFLRIFSLIKSRSLAIPSINTIHHFLWHDELLDVVDFRTSREAPTLYSPQSASHYNSKCNILNYSVPFPFCDLKAIKQYLDINLAQSKV